MKNKYDIIVVGGGFAGAAAAISAGRLGKSVLLIEKYNCMGGAACYDLVNPFMPYATTDPESGERIDVVVTDPPRAGCSPAFLKSLISLAPERVVYISCNPTTISRDLYTLKKGGYKIKKIRPVDLFPYTEHIETVVLLTR